MLHQTLTPPFFHLPFPSSSSIPPPAAAGFHHAPPPLTTKAPPQYFRSSQVEREEVKMECVEAKALKNGFRPEALSAAAHHHHHQQSLLAEEVAWAVERGNLLGEDFSVDDLLDFGGLEPDKEDEQGEEAQDEVFEVENSNSSSSVVSSEDPLPSDIILPAHDEAELEWVSRIIDDSLTEFPPCTGVPPHRPAAQTQPQTKAHYELLPENYRTLTPPPPRPVCSLSTEALVPVKAKRSKRSRSTAGGAWPTFSATTFADSSASTTTTTTTSSSSSCSSSSTYSSCLIYNHAAFLLDGNPPPPKKHKPKKRGRKPKQPPLVAAGVGGAGERRCSHCGTQKTPQWRAGPMGSKTLCNACGVRFKSGRLLPEYRPACSPTFVSHVHSNSHRKVLEMRRKKEEEEEEEEHLDASALPVSIF